jgi:hypothetical protein
VTRTRRRALVLAMALAPAWVAACDGGSSAERRRAREEREAAALDSDLAPASDVEQRSGLAAAILIDVSGSMADSPDGSDEPKIVSARRAADDLVAQFERYAHDHPSEPVLLGVYEFSGRSGESDVREVIPMGPPDRLRAKSAVAAMRPDGGTPIGTAMIAGKRALDATGLSRRHLLVISDGKNTDGYAPEAVAIAIGRRPEIERPSMYFVAFDTSANQFDDMKNNGVLLLEAADNRGLNQTLDTLLRGEILVER